MTNGRKHRVDVPADMPLLWVLRAREERLEARVKSLVAELDLKSGLGRAIGASADSASTVWTPV